MRGTGRFKDANTIAVDGGEDVTFKSAVVATGSYALRPPIDGIDSTRCVDSTGLLADRGAEADRRPRRRDHRLRVRVDPQPLRQRGDDRRNAPTLIPQEDEDAAKELLKQFKKRGIAVHLESQCDRIEETGDGLRVHFAGQAVDADLMLVATGRGPVTQDIGLEAIGVELDPRKGIAADERRRT